MAAPLISEGSIPEDHRACLLSDGIARHAERTANEPDALLCRIVPQPPTGDRGMDDDDIPSGIDDRLSIWPTTVPPFGPISPMMAKVISSQSCSDRRRIAGSMAANRFSITSSEAETRAYLPSRLCVVG